METARLLLQPLHAGDAAFIFELLNTKGWIQFIGNRNINSLDDASAYIQKVQANPHLTYWTVKQKSDNSPTGLITLIKRDYLDHPDIGFAFLPQYSGKGYAYEAAQEVLLTMARNNGHSHFTAITIPGNKSSVKLLEKLGLRYERGIEVEAEKLHVYTVATDKLLIDELTATFFRVFSNKNNTKPNLDILSTICIPEVLIINKTTGKEGTYSLASFVEPRKKLLTDGSLTAFEERETKESTTIIHHIAQRYAEYEKEGILNGINFKESGYKLFQFIKTKGQWKISAVVWQDKTSQ